MTVMAAAQQVRELLATGQQSGLLTVGSRLPTERELAESMSLPRSAVRQALAALEREGLITRHVGRGTFVADGSAWNSAEELMTSPAEIMDTRLLIEPEVAAHAAHSATPTDLEQIDLHMRRGNASETYQEFEEWDASFHRAIAAAVHNGLLMRMFDAMNAARNHPVWAKSKLRAATAERRTAYEEQHAAIVTALMERDPGLAREAMRAHLQSVRTNLLNPPK